MTFFSCTTRSVKRPDSSPSYPCGHPCNIFWIRHLGRATLPERNVFHSNLREVMLYIKYSKDKQTLNKVINEDIKFQSMERQASEVINAVTGSKLKYPEGRCEYVFGDSTNAGRKRN